MERTQMSSSCWAVKVMPSSCEKQKKMSFSSRFNSLITPLKEPRKKMILML